MLYNIFIVFSIRCKHAYGLLHAGDPVAVDVALYTPVSGRLSFEMIIGVALFV